LRAEAAEVTDEDGDFLLGERGGGFVEDEDAGFFVHRADDLYELLLANAEFAHGSFGGEGEAEVGEESGGATVEREPIDAESAARGAAEENIFTDTEFVDQREFLGNNGDAGGLGVADGVEGDWAVVDAEFAFVGAVRMDAGEEFNEGRLAGAVFTAEGVDLARVEIEGDVAEGGDAGEAFGEGASFEEGRHGAA
jgi:hypothetical protein